MLSKESILAAYSKVKTGADFPRLVKDLKAIGVLNYDHIVSDGSNVFYGKDGSSIPVAIGVHQGPIIVSTNVSLEKLKRSLSIHQQGKTDYPTFCTQAGEAGVDKWVSDLEKMTVTYLDKSGDQILLESIPA